MPTPQETTPAAEAAKAEFLHGEMTFKPALHIEGTTLKATSGCTLSITAILPSDVPQQPHDPRRIRPWTQFISTGADPSVLHTGFPTGGPYGQGEPHVDPDCWTINKGGSGRIVSACTSPDLIFGHTSLEVSSIRRHASPGKIPI